MEDIKQLELGVTYKVYLTHDPNRYLLHRFIEIDGNSRGYGDYISNMYTSSFKDRSGFYFISNSTPSLIAGDRTIIKASIEETRWLAICSELGRIVNFEDIRKWN